jgi:C4-dicarboxylate-specific signal transduction histidine kinase
MWSCISLAVLACLLAFAPPVVSAELKNVLVIYSSTRLVRGNNEVARGLQERLIDASAPKVKIFEEFLDQSAFSGQAYETTVETFLREKYASHPLDALIVAGPIALDFLLHHRERLFPGVPVVHVGVDEPQLKALGPVPVDVLGMPAVYDVAGSIRLALRLHPKAQRLVVVTGASKRDRQWETDARAVLSRIEPRPTVEFLAGLSTDALVEQLHKLTDTDVVFTTGYFTDGAGRNFLLFDTVKIIVAEARAPVYGLFAPFMGTGVVGGSMTDFVEMGRQAGGIVNALLDGVPPSQVRLPSGVTAQVEIDWRQVRRWSIDERLIPPDAVIHFKEPTLWEEHRNTVLATLVVIGLQAGLIAALLLERRRRRLMASALVESEQRMSLATRAAGLTVWIWDAARGKVQVHSRRPPGGPAREPSIDFERVLHSVHPADREGLDRAVRRATANQEELDVEYRVLRPDGDVRWIAARGRSAADDETQMTGVAMDVTARKAAELQAERDRAALTHMTRVSTMGQLSASIAHQLNQPLAAILGNAEVARKMLERDPVDRAELAEICDDIIDQDTRAAEIIGRLSALFRRGDMKFAPFDLNELVTETLELVRTELMTRHVVPMSELDPSLPAVDGDRVQLQQVLLNLVLNAADAMKDTDISARRLVIRTTRDGERVRLCVIDNGTGIPSEEIANVFAAFWTTKPSGLGVGLAVSQSIIGAHRGTLAVVNNVDGGATFYATWPITHHPDP